MRGIKIRDLPSGVPDASKLLPMDLTATEKATIKDVVYAGRPAASQAEAEAGTDADKVMTSVATKQSIAWEVGKTIASSSQGSKADSALQPGITTSAVGEGSNLYFTNARSIASTLTSFSTGANVSITSSDTVISGLQKAQGQISALSTNKFDKSGGNITGDTTFIGDAPFVTASSTTGNYAGFRAWNSAGRWDIGIDPSGNLGFFNYSSGGALENVPLTLTNAGAFLFIGPPVTLGTATADRKIRLNFNGVDLYINASLA